MNNLIKMNNKQLPSTDTKQGFVWLVGAGPGDAELLTIKAYKAIQAAEVVLYDWLVDESVLALIPDNAIKEFVGKRCGKHSMIQQDISQRIVFHAAKGRKVVRLKGGDPAIFARTYEETQALEQANIAFSIVPGITSASGASAYSGIPLTQRDCAQSLTLTTASLKNPETEPNWKALVKASKHQTLVFYMGLGKIDLIAQRLIANGLSPAFPIALIDKACTQYQTVIKGTLGSIGEDVVNAAITGPAIIICGQVVNYQQAVSELSSTACGNSLSHIQIAV
ncbi:uroporphyrinogen-III C-methyltransferase [Ningiella sp. W23]|uniref:uroporphyrinogen-III C-methyltransferase n=1 Tax=Ningiella sp. W23 TaxID=3023715 RepID=UPI003757135A